MSRENNRSWLSFEETFDYLQCSEACLRELVENNKIPFSELDGVLHFFPSRLDSFLLSIETTPEKMQDRKTNDSDNLIKLLIKAIIKRSDLIYKNKLRYINLYVSNNSRVCLQLHEDSEGVNLVVPEAQGDEKLSSCKILKQTILKKLKGYWRANSDWLEGNGKRFTNRPAMAYKIPIVLVNDPKHPSWKEVDKLIEYAKSKFR